MKEKTIICEWHMCMEKATVVESCDGKLYSVCREHKKLINRQKKINNNI